MNKLAAGASKAHNKLISDIMRHLNDDGPRPGFGEGGLRKFVLEKISDLTDEAYKKGFKRGHRESYKVLMETGAIPRTLRCTVKRKLAPTSKHEIECKSSLPKK